MAIVIPNRGFNAQTVRDVVNRSPIIQKWANRGTKLIGKGE